MLIIFELYFRYLLGIKYIINFKNKALEKFPSINKAFSFYAQTRKINK